MDERIKLCRFDALGELSPREFEVQWCGEDVEIFLIRKDDSVYAYRNSCPHTGGPLNWQPDQFMDEDKQFIQCATHDALFRIDDGRCLAGPCAGDKLSAIPVVIEAEYLWLGAE